MNTIHDYDYMDMDLGIAYRFLNNQSLLKDAHSHNFYEYFLITSGTIIHNVNGRDFHLSEGNLVLVRPEDCHQYIIDKDKSCEFINVSFTASHFEAACNYLGDYVKELLLSPEFPLIADISYFGENVLVQDHNSLNFYANDREMLRIQLKHLIINAMTLIIKFSSRSAENSGNSLSLILERMNTPENIEKGLPALLEITGYSHGHLCRIMKEQMGISPNQYITNLRMLYSSNLLVKSDIDILTISVKMGYSSLSHFIMVFKKKFGMPPSKYRQIYSKKMI